MSVPSTQRPKPRSLRGHTEHQHCCACLLSTSGPAKVTSGGVRLHPCGARLSSIAEELCRAQCGHGPLWRQGLAQVIRPSGKPCHRGDLTFVFMFKFPRMPGSADRGANAQSEGSSPLHKSTVTPRRPRNVSQSLGMACRALPTLSPPAPAASLLKGLSALGLQLVHVGPCVGTPPPPPESPRTHGHIPRVPGILQRWHCPLPSPLPVPTERASVCLSAAQPSPSADSPHHHRVLCTIY